MKKAVIWIAIAAAVAGILFVAFKPAGGGVKNVDSAELIAAQNKGAQVVDVRSQGEYDLGHIPGAVIVPVDTLQTAAANWDRNATYVVYCATGARSAEAVKIMTGMGFKNIDHFAQGVQAWTGKLDTGAQSSVKTIETAGKPVMIEFYTNSWPTCQEMKPLVEGLEKTYQGKVEFRRLNVETDQAAIDLANKMGVQYVPTFVFVNANGVISKNVVGAMTEPNMDAAVKALQ